MSEKIILGESRITDFEKNFGRKFTQDQKEKISTKLTFRFELLELEMFMRPFQKLIRYAIEDGAESTVENIKNLIDVKYSK